MNSAWWPDGWGKWWWHQFQVPRELPHPSNPASKPLSTTSPTAPQFSIVAPGAPCTTYVVWWSWDPLWLAAHRTSRWAYAWSSWRIFNPRFWALPKAGHRGQTVVAFRSMVLPRHVFFLLFSSFFFLWSELPNRSDHTGAGEQLPPSSLAGCPRRTEKNSK